MTRFNFERLLDVKMISEHLNHKISEDSDVESHRYAVEKETPNKWRHKSESRILAERRREHITEEQSWEFQANR